jgi:hypothetical protein
MDEINEKKRKREEVSQELIGRINENEKTFLLSS